MSLRNRVAAAVRRLRQPKYLAGALAGAAYFYFFLFRAARIHGLPPAEPREGAIPLAGLISSGIVSIGATILLAVVLGRQVLAWLSPPAHPGLRFSEAEIAFLFPAPLTRRRLVHFNLVSSQLTILFSSLLLAVLSQRWRYLGGSPLSHAVGWWVILSTWNLQSTIAGLVVARRSGPGFSRARLAALGAIAAVAAAAVLSVWRRAGAAEPELGAPSPTLLLSYFGRLLDAGVLHWLLWPFRWVVAPFLAPDPRSFALALVPALLLIAILYRWIVRLEVPFEEGSVVRAEKRAQIRAARQAAGPYAGAPARARARRDPFRLAERGRPEIAFLWKNLVGIQAWFNLRVAALAVVVVAAIAGGNLHLATAAARRDGIASLVAMVASIVGFYTLLIGPQLVRQDLRSDLANADILKTYPLAGWQVLLGELLTPVAVLSGFLWLSLLAAAWALAQLGGGGLGRAEQGLLVGCLALIVPPLCALQLVIPNAAAILFPAWFQASRARGGGVEMIGQRLIFALGQWLAVGLALLPAVLLAPAVFVAARFWVGLVAPAPAAFAAATVLATVAGLAVIGGELVCGIWWLGERFEKFDLTTAPS